ncbi:lamin tail domain-containing protein [Candidatus Azambacteria bacterium]|nr:lamin tail domain-containing protein [Candidatus Azambacteria bacterium]
MPFFVLGAGVGDIIINEVMYDLKGADDTHEWVEIYNSSAKDFDITGWKFNDGSNHILNAPPKNGGQGSLVVRAGGYAVFADDAAVFLSDHPGFSGTVIDTVMSLKNTEATLTLFDVNGVSIESASYQKGLGGAGNGMTLERFSTTANWKESAHEGGTPGAQNGGASIVPAEQIAPPAAPTPSPAPLPQASPVEQAIAPMSGSSAPPNAPEVNTQQKTAAATEPPIVAQDKVVPSEAEASSAPVKEQRAGEPPAHAKKVAKKEDISENTASADQTPLEGENTQHDAPQPALASRAFGYNVYFLIIAACGLLAWLSFRRRPTPVAEDEEESAQ